MFAEQYGSAQHAFEELHNMLQSKGGEKKIVRNVSIELTSPMKNEIETPWRTVKWINFEYLESDFTLNFHQYLNELNLTVYVRTLDLVYGFCNTQNHFSKMLQDISLRLKCQVGNITFMITELYLHQEHFNLKTNYDKTNQIQSQS